jgi:hypothetical protein
LLTPEFVRAVKPPAKGERWIADTKLKGFGLRLWATPSGVGKAFALRTSNAGKKARKTFDPRPVFVGLVKGRKHLSSQGLVDSLESARSWARDEIDIAKGRSTLEEDRQARREHIARRMNRLTLEQAAEKLTRGMLAEGRSQPYVDRLNKLFAIHVPQEVRSLRLSEVPPRKLARALVSMAGHGGNLRTLKSFVRQIYDRAATFNGSLRAFSSELSEQFWKQWQIANRLPFPELQNLEQPDYEAIFAILEAEEDRWQQALCIRLFFIFGAPLSRLRVAQWRQIIGDRWYPYLPEEKVYWFESAENINSDAKALLDRLRNLGRVRSKRSAYWFPCATDPRKPIATTHGTWRETLNRVGSRYYPLGEFARSYRAPNNPTYAMAIVRQFGAQFREIKNAAKVSKELERRVGNQRFQRF